MLTSTMETMNVLGQFLSSYGFPIVACGAMFWYINKQTDAHKEETTKMTEALNNNTTVLTRILDKLGVNSND